MIDDFPVYRYFDIDSAYKIEFLKNVSTGSTVKDRTTNNATATVSTTPQVMITPSHHSHRGIINQKALIIGIISLVLIILFVLGVHYFASGRHLYCWRFPLLSHRNSGLSSAAIAEMATSNPPIPAVFLPPQAKPRSFIGVLSNLVKKSSFHKTTQAVSSISPASSTGFDIKTHQPSGVAGIAESDFGPSLAELKVGKNVSPFGKLAPKTSPFRGTKATGPVLTTTKKPIISMKQQQQQIFDATKKLKQSGNVVKARLTVSASSSRLVAADIQNAANLTGQPANSGETKSKKKKIKKSSKHN